MTEPQFKLVERRDPGHGGEGWTERWVCDPPDVELHYVVLRDEWNNDDTVRTIYEIKVLDG